MEHCQDMEEWREGCWGREAGGGVRDKRAGEEELVKQRRGSGGIIILIMPCQRRKHTNVCCVPCTLKTGSNQEGSTLTRTLHTDI